MANSSSTTQVIQTQIKNELGLDFDIDLSTNCQVSADIAQEMTNITISGSKGVELKQMSDLQSLCQARDIVDLDIFSQLSSQAQNDILNKLNQEGGLPGANISNSNLNVLNQIENKVSVEAKLKATKDCFSQLQVPQVMEGITIEDAMDINLSQTATNLNKCIFDTATDIAQKNGVELETETTFEQDVTQKGWDPIESIGGVLGSAAMLALAPAITSLVVVILSSVVGGGSAMKGTGSGPEGIPPPPGTAQAPMLGGAISKMLGIHSRKGKRLIVLLVKITLIAVVAYALYRLFKGKEQKEGYHSNVPKQHTGYQTRPLAIRQQYHHPHISEDMFPSERTHPNLLPPNEVPEYVKRWY